MIRYIFLTAILVVALVLGAAGFRGEKFTRRPLELLPDMDNQAKIKSQADSNFFADGAGGRRPVASTIPMGLNISSETLEKSAAHSSYGFTAGTDYYNTGRFGDSYWGDGIPGEIEINPAFIRLGAERYNIYCAVCHAHSGDGKGITGNYGINGIRNLHEPALSDPKDPLYRPDGNIFNTITYGMGQMGPYGAMIPVRDRWAIVAYVRTLQLAKASSAPAPAAAPAATPEKK